MIHRIVLIPGFFGFVNLGELAYFSHVHRYIEDWAVARNIAVTVHRPITPPTASLLTRAAVLHKTLATECPTGPIHLIGHSAGGLDARILCTPGVAVPGIGDTEPVVSRVQSVVSVSTPHLGTPVANLFASAMGGPLLRLLSAVSVVAVRGGAIPLSVLTTLAKALANPAASAMQPIADELIADADPRLAATLRRFVEDVNSDQGLVSQLATSQAALTNAASPDRAGIRYASVATIGRRPGVRSALSQGLRPDRYASHALYSGLWTLTSTSDIVAPAGAVGPSGADIAPSDNDGVVPTASQLRGNVLATVSGDHLDVLGHFSGRNTEPPHYDWVSSGSEFDVARFRRVWDAVCEFSLA